MGKGKRGRWLHEAQREQKQEKWGRAIRIPENKKGGRMEMKKEEMAHHKLSCNNVKVFLVVVIF